MVKLVICLFLLSCYVSVVYCQCSKPNDCSSVIGKPYCYNGTCVQCNPDSLVPECECSPGQYCVTDPSDNERGSCKPFESNIIGRSCQLSLQNAAYRNNGCDVKYGENDLLYCGLLKFDEVTNCTTYVEWEGVCIRNICHQCSQAPFSQVPYAICSDGRICDTNFEMVLAPGGLLSWQYIIQNRIVFFFICICSIEIGGFIFITCASIILPLYPILKEKHKRKKLNELTIQEN